MTQFSRYIGIDYSGAETAESSLKGLRVYEAMVGTDAVEVQPPASPRRYWTRRGIAEWLVARLAEPIPTLIGIDHGFSFPMRYFHRHDLQPDWDTFLVDFQRHWPTDQEYSCVEFVREGIVGAGAQRSGSPRWRRLCEEACGAKSVFHFDVPGSVAKSTHAGLPWLLYLRRQLGGQLHFWPFDGWDLPPGKSAIVEVYPRLYSHAYRRQGRTPDQHDAYSAASWLRDADKDGRLQSAISLKLSPQQESEARIEGWILGVQMG